MRTPLLGALAATMMLSNPAFAQVNGDPATQPTVTPPAGTNEVQRGYANPAMPDQAAVNAGSQDTAALNSTVNQHLQDQQALNAANQAIFDADRATDLARYDAALSAHDRAVRRDDRRYQHQQQAYADAMSAWRAQVSACLAGHKPACNAPPPDPASFY